MIDPANHSKIEQNNEKALINEDATEISNEHSEPSEDQKGQLIKAETSETGHVKLKVYLAYFKSLGYVFSFIFVGLIALQESLHLTGNIWLANWSDANVAVGDEDQIVKNVSYYLWGYAIIGITEMVLKLGNDLSYFFRYIYVIQVRKSRKQFFQKKKQFNLWALRSFFYLSFIFWKN